MSGRSNRAFNTGDHQTFAEYAEYVLELKERSGAKHNTVLEYRYLLTRINEAIGNMKLSDIRPQHLNRLYKDLQSAETRMSTIKATGKKELTAKLKMKGMTRERLAQLAHVSHTTVTMACRGEPIRGDKAAAIARALEEKPEDIFTLSQRCKPLSSKTVVEHHRLIHAVLA